MINDLLKSYYTFSLTSVLKLPYLHYCLIILDYFLVFACSINAAIRLLFSNRTQFYFQQVLLNFTSINPLHFFRISMFSQTATHFYPVEELAIIPCCLLIHYFLIFLLSRKEKASKRFPLCLSIVTNFFELFFFRYCSLFAVDLQVNIFLGSISRGGMYFIIALCAVLLLVLYYWTLFTCVFVCVIWTVLKPDNLSIQVINTSTYVNGDYPFDRIFSAKYDVYMSLLKFLLCLELNVFEISGAITGKVIFLGISLLIFHAHFFAYLVYLVFSPNGLITFAFNRGYNLTRMAMIVFHTISLVLVLIFYTETTSIKFFAWMFSFVLLFTIFIVYSLWRHHIKKKFFENAITVPQLLYLISCDFRHNEDKLQIELYINLLMQQHESKCLMHANCRICNTRNSNTNDISNNFAVLFRFLFKHVKVRNATERLYYDLIKLFYYFYMKKTFKLFSHYYTCLQKYKKNHMSLIYNMNLVLNLFSNQGKENSVSSYLTKVLHLHQICEELENLIGFCYTFLQLQKQLRLPEHFISIANRMRNICDSFNMVYHTIDFKDDNYLSFDNAYQRNYKESIKYLLLVERFVIESLFNKPLENAIMNDLELMEEYICNHFTNDKHMLIAAKLRNEVTDMISSGGLTLDMFTIIQTQGELCKFKGRLFGDIIPHDFREEGLSKFFRNLKKFKNSINIDKKNEKNEVHSTSKFEFLISMKTYTEVFLYVFFPHATMTDNSIIIQGEYRMGYKNIIITEKYNDHYMTLHSFSKKFKKVLMINPKWLERLQKNRGVLRLDFIFSKIKLEATGDFECFMSYTHYNQWYCDFISALMEESDFNSSEQEEAQKDFKFLKSRSSMRYKLSFLKEYEFTCQNRTFSVYSMKEINLHCYNSLLNSVVYKTMEDSIISIEGNGNIFENEYEGYNSTATQLRNTNSSVTSVGKMSFERWMNNEHHRVFSNESTKQLDSFMRIFSIFTMAVIMLNVIIVALSVAFMVLQSFDTTEFKEMYNLFIEYKRMRNTVADSYLSMLSNICIGELNTPNGVNYYEQYSKRLSVKAQCKDLRLYILHELKYKHAMLKERFQNFQNNLFIFNNPQLLSLLKLKMNYFTLVQNSNDGLDAIVSEITLEEGIKRYINSIAVMIYNDPTFDKSPVYLFSIKGKSLDMSSVYSQHIHPAQRETYHIIANYINYVQTFSICEAQFLSQFENFKNYNMTVLIAFMIMIDILNGMLFCLVLWNIFFARHMISQHVTEMDGELNKAEFKLYHSAKLSNLRSLSQLYEADPNQLIKKINSDKKKTLNLAKKNSKLSHIKLQETNSEDKENKNKTENVNVNGNVNNNNNNDYGFLINSFLNLSFLLFGFYFIYAVFYTVLLLSTASDVYDTIDYVLTNVKLENYVYNNMNIIQVMSLANITEDEFSDILGEAPKSTGLMNYRLQLTLEYWANIQQEQSRNSNFHNELQVINYTCDTMFLQINDSITYSTSAELKEDYFLILEKLCKVFNFTDTQDFGLLIHEITYQSYRILSKKNLTSYESRAELNRFDPLFEVYTLLLIFFRQIRNYFLTELFLKAVNDVLVKFTIVISTYMAFNIVINSLIFLVIKRNIVTKFQEISKNLILLEGSFLC